MNEAQRLELLRRFAAANPEPKGELDYRTPFELLIAVILSAQATDVSVNKATGPLFAVANTASQIYTLGEEGLKPYIRSIGLYNSKAHNIVLCCEQLLSRHQGEVPEDREALEALAGVGRKTANVVLNVAFGWPTIAVDTHLFRVSNRTGYAPGKNVVAVEKRLLAVTPAAYQHHLHHWFILHGRYICKARSPRCHDCLIADLCVSRSNFA